MLAQHLAKGRRVGIDGRLDWSSWEAQDGSKRSKVEVVAFQVQFLDSRGEGEGGERQFVPAGARQENADFSSSAADDDIPF
jgi:single-strand DNA-binding protein